MPLYLFMMGIWAIARKGNPEQDKRAREQRAKDFFSKIKIKT
jgi:hypothetical protein